MRIDSLTPERAALAELGRRLMNVRTQRRLSRLQLAQEAGLGSATIARIESGASAQLSSWIRILAALNMGSAVDLMVPETYASPMAEALKGRGRRKPGTRQERSTKWGDER